MGSPVEVAPLMLAAYRGTPDDEGETLEETVGVLTGAMSGAYGEWLPAASFMALEGDEPVGAALTAKQDEVPFIAFIFTRPDRLGTGIASRLIGRICQALAEDGHETIDLWVNPANDRALRLYRRLGFSEV